MDHTLGPGRLQTWSPRRLSTVPSQFQHHGREAKRKPAHAGLDASTGRRAMPSSAQLQIRLPTSAQRQARRAAPGARQRSCGSSPLSARPRFESSGELSYCNDLGSCERFDERATGSQAIDMRTKGPGMILKRQRGGVCTCSCISTTGVYTVCTVHPTNSSENAFTLALQRTPKQLEVRAKPLHKPGNVSCKFEPTSKAGGAMKVPCYNNSICLDKAVQEGAQNLQSRQSLYADDNAMQEGARHLSHTPLCWHRHK